jgi:hypothetical protein
MSPYTLKILLLSSRVYSYSLFFVVGLYKFKFSNDSR